MIRLAVLVEGQTEEKFIKELISPFLLKQEVFAQPIILTTRFNNKSKDFKGGSVKYKRIKKEILQLCNSFDYVSTMIDYYGLQADFPGYRDSFGVQNIYDKIDSIETEFAKDINQKNFLPYLQLHEFEALLFSSIIGFKKHYQDSKQIDKVQKIISKFPNPELINNDKNTSPSNRLKKIFPYREFQKTADGIFIANYLGLNKIREKCSHFNDWIYELKCLN